MATILIPLLQYINRKSQTYFLDLMGIPFVIFLVVTITSVINPNVYTFALFSFGVAIEIILYTLITFENYLFEKYRLTHRS